MTRMRKRITPSTYLLIHEPHTAGEGVRAPEPLQYHSAAHEVLGPVAAHTQERDCRRTPIDRAGAEREGTGNAQASGESCPSPRSKDPHARPLEGGQLEGGRRHAVPQPFGLSRAPANPAIEAIVQLAILEK